MKRVRLYHQLQLWIRLAEMGGPREGWSVNDQYEEVACQVKAQRSAMVGRKGAQNHEGVKGRPVSEGKMKESGKTVRGEGLYTWRKRRVSQSVALDLKEPR